MSAYGFVKKKDYIHELSSILDNLDENTIVPDHVVLDNKIHYISVASSVLGVSIRLKDGSIRLKDK